MIPANTFDVRMCSGCQACHIANVFLCSRNCLTLSTSLVNSRFVGLLLHFLRVPQSVLRLSHASGLAP